jgi:hypothetical protein
MKALARRHRGEAVFWFVYCRDAHRPAGGAGSYLRGGQPARQAVTVAERRLGAALVRGAVEPDRRLLLDGFGGDSLFERLFGGSRLDNPAVIVGADGKVAAVLDWADAEQIEAILGGQAAGPAVTP